MQNADSLSRHKRLTILRARWKNAIFCTCANNFGWVPACTCDCGKLVVGVHDTCLCVHDAPLRTRNFGSSFLWQHLVPKYGFAPITALPVDIRPTTLKGQERKPG